MSNYYTILGVHQTCSMSEIKKAYKKLALQFHPDKNPSKGEKFKKISEAYRILSNSETRTIYDNRESKSYETFNAFFEKMHKSSSIYCNLDVTLKEFYKGCYIDINVNRKIVCSACTGGEACAICKGTRLVSVAVTLKVNIPKGTKDGHKVTFPDEGNQEPGLRPGDVIVTLKEKPDLNFKRIGDDLYCRMRLSLAEALCGFKRILTTLDDRSLVVSTDKVTRPDSFRAIFDEGMPTNSCSKLFVQFKVKFPKVMDERTRVELKSILPPVPDRIVPDDVVHVLLYDINPPPVPEKHEQHIPCPIH